MTDPVVAETLTALQMPHRGLKNWFAHLKARCGKHGGERLYADLRKLVEKYDAALRQPR